MTTKIIGLTLQRYSKHDVNRMQQPVLQRQKLVPQGAQQDQYGGFVRNRLEDWPRQGGVHDLLEGAVPAAREVDNQGRGGQGHDTGTQDITQQGGEPRVDQPAQGHTLELP